MHEAQQLVFGPFRLDLRDERLWREQEVMHLSPKTLASASGTPGWRQLWRVCCIGAPMGIPYS